MTYDKAMFIAKNKSMNDDESYMVYYDSEEGHEGYWVRQEDDYWLLHDDTQTEVAEWWDGGVFK